jgi:valyl-tRNA synthetase
LFSDFRLSEALKTLYSLIWDDFCSWYLEWIKPGFGQAIGFGVYNKTIQFFEDLIHLLHPFMPFITEEIYHLLGNHTDDLCVKQFTPIKDLAKDASLYLNTEKAKEIIQRIREFRTKTGKKRDEKISIYRENEQEFSPDEFNPMLAIVNSEISAIAIQDYENSAGRILNLETILIGTSKLYLDLGTLGKAFTGAIKSQLTSELARLTDFLASLDKKLQNERFVQNARPEVIENERKKRNDTELKIKAIEDSLSKMN